MKIGLGIDTGGTYTDAVLYDFDGGRVICSEKALTTKNDLAVGISEAVGRLDARMFADIKIVSLSTTLATNACVENRGRDAKLIIIDGDREIIGSKHADYMLPPAEDIYFIDGKISIKGDVVEEPDWDKAERELAAIRETVNCAAVAGMLSSRNPAHENKLKAILTKLGFISICSTDLAPDELNYLKRASTVLLNARLLPIISEFLDAVNVSLANFSISAPVYIVRGDGSLMKEEFARERPVDTLMCGPTASVAGAMTLTDVTEAVIIDIGGTTSDLALIRGGEPVKSHGNLKIGGWQTTVDSTYIETFGLGGDSGVSLAPDMQLVLESRRIVPLCVLASKYSTVTDDLARMRDRVIQGRMHVYEFYEYIKDDPSVTKEESEILSLLKEKPMTPDDIADATDTSIYALKLKRLESLGCVMRSGFTPTDVMHITGEFAKFRREASVLGAEYFTNLMKISLEELCKAVLDKFSFKLYSGIVNIISHGGPSVSIPEKVLEYTYSGADANLVSALSTNNVLVGVGAPTHVFLKYAAEKLRADFVIPENAHVANAVGAIACGVDVSYKVTIQPNEKRWVVLGTREVTSFEDKDDAVEYAKTEAKIYAEEIAKNRGLTGELEAVFDVNHKKSIAKTDVGLISVDIEIAVTVKIKGKVWS